MKSLSLVRASDTVMTVKEGFALLFHSARKTEKKDTLVAGLATRAPGSNHVFILLVDIGAVLFKDHDAQRAVV